jgi:hypothetical protein
MQITVGFSLWDILLAAWMVLIAGQSAASPAKFARTKVGALPK